MLCELAQESKINYRLCGMQCTMDVTEGQLLLWEAAYNNTQLVIGLLIIPIAMQSGLLTTPVTMQSGDTHFCGDSMTTAHEV